MLEISGHTLKIDAQNRSMCDNFDIIIFVESRRTQKLPMVQKLSIHLYFTKPLKRDNIYKLGLWIT